MENLLGIHGKRPLIAHPSWKLFEGLQRFKLNRLVRNKARIHGNQNTFCTAKGFATKNDLRGMEFAGLSECLKVKTVSVISGRK
ncbi:MAG: hypothetical protein A2V86_05385 [Deltaproteobacteria bacterium RBG_16_49_23]|nr:MAG: hypothetical protein A2V86_05385 [Deltaproteobacteria bacterium RBG_16_49_23]